MEKKIHFRAVIEVLGKPKEHVEKSIKSYLDTLKKNENYEVTSEDLATIKKQDDSELWMIFAEIEAKTSKIEDLVAFCFDYMPSLIELIEPKEMKFTDEDISLFLNDLQAKLHTVDMIAKQVKAENSTIKLGINSLLGNYITLLLTKRNMTAEELSNLTGVVPDKLADFLDQLIDQGRINLKEGIYFLTKKEES